MTTHQRYRLLMLMLGGSSVALLAQTTPATTTAPAKEEDKDEIVHLSPFMVGAGESDSGRYTSLESTSAGRVRTSIMDSSQNISVITSEMLQDVGAARILDATKYIAGISESTLPNAQDRTNVRGFQADGHTMDGFTTGGFLSIDPILVDRIEVVKGPNAILAPQPTSPGGTVNNASKKPQFRDFNIVGASVGLYDGNSAFIDVNRKWSDKIATRVILSGRSFDSYWDGAYMNSTTFMPGITYRFSDTAQLTLQYIFTDWESSLYLGLPIDPSVGTRTKARTIDGVARDLSVFADDIFRTDRRHDFKLNFTAELFKGLNMRLAALYRKSSQYGPQLNTGNSSGGTGGSRDPQTGLWMPGLVFGAAPTYTASAAPAATRTFTRSGTDPRNDPRQFFIQNDYVYQVENDTLKSTTLVGFSFTETSDDSSIAYNISAPAFNIDTYTDTGWTRGTLNFNNRLGSRHIQAYVSQSLSLLSNRLILNAATSKNYYRQRTSYLVTGLGHKTGPEADLPSYGIVIKPWKDQFSMYYGYSEQSTSLGPSNHVVNQNPLLQSSKQTEFGIRSKLLGDKLYFTISNFDIKQNNFSVPNPANLTTPPPNPLLPPLFSDRTAKGWEYELRYNPTKNLSIIGNYTHFKNRDPNNVEFRGTAEKTGAILLSYSFDHGTGTVLENFRVTLGMDYIGSRPGDSAPAPVLVNGKYIAQQPSFYLSSRSLLNLGVIYKSKNNWTAQLNVDNLLDKEYLAASINRSLVYTGYPINYRLSTSYKF